MMDAPSKTKDVKSAPEGASSKASSGPVAPVPTLPKGGGAIHGIGEKFSANPVTGTASLQIPLATSPGRGGFHPELTLAYDSGSGNGPFGLGWHLSIPQITRKTDKGLPQYDDARDSDVFLLSGAEDLVPTLREDMTRDTYVDTVAGEVVQRYRPRIEGSFARIERRERTADGDVYWTATTPDNTTSVYGRSTNARIADPRDARCVFTWLLEETRDDKGNVLQYKYKAEDLVNVPKAAPFEANRHKGAAPITNRYLKRIRYGNTTPSDPSPELDSALFEVVFDYGEHDAIVPTVDEAQLWPCRQDPFSSYRAGFETRTYRLCRRVLMFHRMAELGATPCLVRSTDFTHVEAPTLTRLIAATQAGYLREVDALTYTKKAFPPVEFGYSLPEIHTTVQVLDKTSLADVPGGVQGAYQWVDLDGEGLPGVLTQQAGALFYKQNLGDGKLAPVRRLLTKPAMTQLGGGQQLTDLDGDGRKELTVFSRPMAGYHDRTEEGGWAPFRPFASQPNIDWNDPNLRFIDLNGDGHEDVLIAQADTFTWYPSIAKRGFGQAITLRKPHDDEKGPALVFAEGTMTIFLADMSGDGLTDIVRVKNGGVCYWPNLGYGRFGAKVQMGGAMRFDNPDQFDPRRIRLADVDGTGTVDVLYIHRDGVRIFANQAGNALAVPIQLPRFPDQSDLSSIGMVDLLGTGTGCLVWSSPLPGQGPAPLRYVDLLGSEKPYLLTSYKNNLGLEVKLSYAPSTKFYRQDAAAGTPWVTRLPFVVHALERVESYDAVSRHRFMTTYAYHHGYFDGAEREFRGFGMVEQWDTESFSRFSGAGTLPLPANASDPELHLPPVRTKSWFHTGAWIAGARIAAQFETEYFQAASNLPDTVFERRDAPHAPLSEVGTREGCRALKGQLLRQEIYAEDGTSLAHLPYTVSERSYAVRQIQAPIGSSHGVFLSFPREAVEYHYERNASDPRITHAFTLAVDDFGTVTRSAAVGYPRRATAQTPHAEQTTTAITLTEVQVAHKADQLTWYRLGVPVETRTYQLTGIAPAQDELLTFEAMLDAATQAIPIQYEDAPGAQTLEKRLLSQSRTLYASDDRSGPLALGEIESLALPWQSYTKAFTPALLASALGGRATDAILVEGGYVRFLVESDAWWVPSGRAQFRDASSFYLPDTFSDPFGNTSTVVYDAYHLAVLQAIDPLGNTILAEHDYRVLAPVLVTDANGNRAAARFDELGRVVATAIMGKVGDADGDTLAEPTTTFDYDLTRFATTGKPNVVHSRAREQHGVTTTRWQEAYSYSDGSGREVMKKIPAEPGLAPTRDGAGALVHDTQGKLVLAASNPRWVGTGRTVFDNKGNPVKQYEPFFSSTPAYEDETELVEWGVTPVLRYDALGRLTRTDLPNGTFSTIELDAWKQTTFDPNDNVAPLDPNDIAGESLWYQARKGLDPAADPEGRAAALAYAHRGTPGVAHLDALGRTFLTIEDNGAAGSYATRLSLDIEGNPLVIADARQNEAMRHVLAMGGRKLWQKSCDAGQQWMLADVGGAPLRAWDERGHTKQATYDAARRATHQYVQQGAAAEQLVGRTVYGEAHPNAATLNLRGRAYQVYDGAGVVTSGAYDFKGNLLHGTRRLAADYHAVPDWSALAGLTDVAAIATAAESLLEGEVFASATAYDALNRPTSTTAPDASEIRPTYNEAGLLEKVEVRVRGAATWTTFVDDIDYDAKGQREKIVYGNGTRTTYTYDPETFRLVRLKTVRSNSGDAGPQKLIKDGAVLQNLAYTYDPVGNITEIKDSAHQKVFFDNEVVSPSTQYVYDALYRLTQASGREHAGGIADVQRDQNDVPLMNLPHANDGQALRSYVEQYVYDAVGNIRTMSHQAGVGSWTREYQIAAASNRLLGTSLPGDQAGQFSATYAYDAHGSMTSMPHLPAMGWEHNDQMHQVDLGGGGTAYYTYDAAGQRVRKVWEHSGLVEERIYLGGWEVYRKRDSLGNLLVERETLHGMDGTRRVVLVETKTVDVDAGKAFTVVSRYRFQLDNHLGSASLEVDESGLVIGYEEYHPYGTTAYASGRSGVEVSGKRYRYTGKERDEETGLYYHGARYYAPWLGRWTAADPAGLADGANLYTYVRNAPIVLSDPTGRLSWLDSKIDSIFNPSNPIAKGVVANLYKRGEALANAPEAITQLIKKEGAVGLAKAVGSGVHHLVKDTGEALGEVAWEASHYEEDKSKQKIANRLTDVVLNTADAVTLVAGGVGIAKGGIAAAKSVTTTVKVGMAVLKGGTGSLALAGGGVTGAKALAGTAGLTVGAPGLGTLGGSPVMMSTLGKGAGTPPGGRAVVGGGKKPASRMAGEARPDDVTIDMRKSVDPDLKADFNNLTPEDVAELQRRGSPFQEVLFERTGIVPNQPPGVAAAGLTERAFHNAFAHLRAGGILSVQTVDAMEDLVRQGMKAAGFGPVTKTQVSGGVRLTAPK